MDSLSSRGPARLPAEVGPEALEEVKETEVLQTWVEDVWDLAISIETEGARNFHETMGTCKLQL